MGDKYCGKCGSKLDKKTGLCPNCDDDQIRSRRRLNEKSKVTDSNSQNRRNNHRKEDHRSRHYEKRTSFGSRLRRFVLRLLTCLLLIALLVLGAIISLVYFDVVQFPAIETILYETGIKHDKGEVGNFDEEPINIDDYKIEAPNPNDIFNDHFEIVEVTDIADSNTSLTEEELIKILNERGFTEHPITTNYDMEGRYSDTKEVAPSTEKHPIYETSYISSNNEYWIISVVDGDIMATPVSFNIESNSNTSVLISESNYITSFVSSTNQFYRTIPDESVLDVVVVDKINTDTLDRLTLEELP